MNAEGRLPESFSRRLANMPFRKATLGLPQSKVLSLVCVLAARISDCRVSDKPRLVCDR